MVRTTSKVAGILLVRHPYKQELKGDSNSQNYTYYKSQGAGRPLAPIPLVCGPGRQLLTETPAAGAKGPEPGLRESLGELRSEVLWFKGFGLRVLGLGFRVEPSG